MGINNYYFNNIGARLWDIDNQDFWLTSDDQGTCLSNYVTSDYDGCNDITDNYDIIRDGLVVWFDISRTGTTIDGTSLTSLTSWDKAEIKYTSGKTSNCGCYVPLKETPTGITSCDWGLTGVDNGRYDMLSGITVTFTTADTKVVLYPVTGYTVNDAFSVGTKGKYDYPWTFRPNQTTPDGCQVGETICLNGGFYQGFFKLDLEKPNPISVTSTTQTKCSTNIDKNYKNVDPDALKYDLGPTDFDCGSGKGGWSMETWIKWDNSYCSSLPGDTLNENFPDNSGFFFYIGTRAENKFKNIFSGETGLYTCDGIIPLSPEEDGPRVTTDGQDWFSVSSFGKASCCNTCKPNTPTVTATTYCDELSENALGFRITPEGRIGYRKMTVSGYEYWCKKDIKEGTFVSNDCGTNGNAHFMITGTTMEENYSPTFSISGDTNKWYHIVVTYSQNTVKNGLPAGTLRFWVDGRVIFRVENFIGLKLRALNEYSSKQLGVPYNFSWGGGSQGLLESQTFGGPDPKDQDLSIAKYFAGTFEGELSQLRFYDKTLNLMEIRNNFYFDKYRYCIKRTYGGAQILQPDSPLCGECNYGNTPSYLLYDDTCYIITENGDKIIL
jgi:hypothetical protein